MTNTSFKPLSLPDALPICIALPDLFRPDLRDGNARVRIERDGQEPVEEVVAGDQYGLQVSRFAQRVATGRSEEHTSELQSRGHLVCRLLLEKNKYSKITYL